MGKRKQPFVVGGYYHIFNRGNDKRKIFINHKDFERFLDLLELCNFLEPMRHFGEAKNKQQKIRSQASNSEKLVKIHAYSLLENHYHLVLEQYVENGITMFMQKLGTSYTKYFNTLHERSGSLFQGKFKSVEIDSDIYFTKIFSYTSANHVIHGITDPTKYRSSWKSYFSGRDSFLSKGYVTDRFISEQNFLKHVTESNNHTKNERSDNKTLKDLLID